MQVFRQQKLMNDEQQVNDTNPLFESAKIPYTSWPELYPVRHNSPNRAHVHTPYGKQVTQLILISWKLIHYHLTYLYTQWQICIFILCHFILLRVPNRVVSWCMCWYALRWRNSHEPKLLVRSLFESITRLEVASQLFAFVGMDQSTRLVSADLCYNKRL